MIYFLLTIYHILRYYSMERIFDNTFWKVDFSSKAAKQARKLPDDILSHLYALKLDLVTTA